MPANLPRVSPKPRVLIFIVAYNAEKTVCDVVRRIPAELAQLYEVEILIIDDASQDATFVRSHRGSKSNASPFPVHALFNPVNQGYGGNQKLGYEYAIENGFDFVALLHGDGQYAPECLPELLEPLRKGEADAVFGSRMLTPKGALKGGMPLYKFIGNRILTWLENRLLGSGLSEFHSGYRLYSVAALQAIPFDRNSQDFHFDTEIIIQLLIARRTIRELPIPTYYGDEVCHVNGMKYAANVALAAVKARLQEWSLFYDRRFDCAPAGTYSPHMLKLGYLSPHTLTLDRITPGSRVLDVGCAGHVGAVLKREKGCSVEGFYLTAEGSGDGSQVCDMSSGIPPVRAQDYDSVVLLDVIEHLKAPDAFLENLRQALAENPSIEVLISTANVGCIVARCMLLMGQFNYGKRGILDQTHTRLFTLGSLRRTLDQAGFDIVEIAGVPAPFPLAVGDNKLSRALLAINQGLIRLWRGLFAYQIFMRVKPRPTVKSLLSVAREQSGIRAAALDALGTDAA